ncbi:unnamed protein product [Darwinula stevensoni]|uniref:Uncharacterized protein n=1 Tax=Darwinula stevensoni TaxID=69355 RepID=A0A7R8WXY5_9CRUS|nr:unnamed protein product [Darwinula stevensoni]CAG0878867.1 unnamed protein product [Darwinula stevensoni]
MADAEKLLEAIEEPVAEEKPKEPPIVFRDLNPKAEYDSLCRNLGERNIPEDRQALSEIKEYTVKDEGAWALSDETIHFIGKLLHDKELKPGVRSKLLRLLACAALKDDIILLLHQDRKEHQLMNYAHDMELHSHEEQEALALFICNLFETTSSSEWLLYISEWNREGLQLSNVRVTTKVAVTALLSNMPTLQEKGTALMHNLATKEVKSAVFDDIATELSMAILQFLTSNPKEEWLFRAMKALLRFCQISYNDVPALIKMIGPEPAKFKGVSDRIDEIVDQITFKLETTHYRQPEVPA